MSEQQIQPDMKNPVHFLAFGFGSGLLPKAPGTFGTLAAVPIFLVLAQFSTPVYLASVLFICLAGIYLCGQTSRDLGVHDHGGIVWDEIAGFLITMTLIPVGVVEIILGFVLFRLFDIWKPWPISWLDRRLSGGLGIMLDDIVAGIFAWFVLQLILGVLMSGSSL